PARLGRQVQEGRSGLPARADHHLDGGGDGQAGQELRRDPGGREEARRAVAAAAARRSAEGGARLLDAGARTEICEGHDIRILGFSVTLLWEGRSDPQANRRDLRQGCPRRVPQSAAPVPSALDGGGGGG